MEAYSRCLGRRYKAAVDDPSPRICPLSLAITGTSLAVVLLCLLLPLNLSSVMPNSILNPYIPLASTMLTDNALRVLQQLSISSPKQKWHCKKKEQFYGDAMTQLK